MKVAETTLTELRARGERLSARLGQAAEDMKTSGICPSASLLAELANYSDSFDELCRRLYEISPAWRSRTFHSAVDLEDAISSEQTVAQALEIVDNAGLLRHLDDRNHPGISQLQKEVQRVHQQLESRDTGAVRLAEELLAGRHSINSLMQLLNWGDTLSDEQWVHLQDIVTEAFGRELAVAVARGKIVATGSNAISDRLTNVEPARQ